MDIMGKMKAQEQGRQKTAAELKEAEEAKAAEYAALQARIDELETTVTSLQTTIDGLNKTLQTITPQDIQKFKDESLTIFQPLQKTAEAVNTKIKAAGYEAAQELKRAGSRTFTDYLYEAVVISILFVGLNAFVLWGIFGLSDMKKTINYISNETDGIHYNQTTGRTAGTFDPWHMSDFWKKYNEVGEQVRQQMIEAAKQQQQK